VTNRLRRVVCVVFLLALAATAVPPSPADAQEERAEPAFALLAQDPPWVALGGDVLLRLDVPASLLPADEDVTLRLRIHEALETTSAFDDTVEGDRLGNRVDDTYEVSVSTLIRDAQGAVYVAFGIAGSTRDPAFDISTPGVYPLEVALRTDETLASFVTWVVVGGATQTAPVHLAQVWNATSAPVRNAAGEPDPEVVDELAPGGRLAGIADLLDESGPLPLTLEVGPEMLESWAELSRSDARLAPGYEHVREAAARATTQLLPAPYVPIDLTALEAAGLGAQLPNQLRTGARALEAATNVSPNARTAYIDPVDAPVLARVRDLLVDRVAVPAQAVTELQSDETLRPFVLAAGEGTVRAVASSPKYEDLLTGDASPALRAQRLLAGLSVLAFEHDTPSGVVLAAPARWSPDLDTMREVIEDLAGHPYVQAARLDDLFTSVPEAAVDGNAVTRALAPHEPGEFPITSGRYDQAQRALAGLRSSVGPSDPAVVASVHALDLSLSTDNSSREAEADLAVVDAAAGELQENVSPVARRVTLTARRADVPITFVNQTGRPVRVRVQLASGKLLFPTGAEQFLDLPPGESTERFAVEARASGTFTMNVSLTSADGNLRLGTPARVTVRSTVFSGAGAALTAGALLFLALWWGNHFRRTRRARRAAATT
jgi:hypothetical protein